jgi:ABC-2 type transport system permease protein
MNSASTSFPAPRVVPNARHAFGGIWRLTVRRFFSLTHWLVVAGMLVLLVLFSIPAASSRAEAAHEFLAWASRFYVCFLVPILAFISAGGVMRDDLRADTVDYIFTRPVARPAFILFRYLSHVACAQLDFLLALGVVTGIGIYWQVPGFWNAVPLLLLAQVLAIVAFSAFGFFCGLLTSRYVIIGLVYAAVIEAGIGNVPTQLAQLSMVLHLLTLMRPIVGEGQMGMTAVVSANSLSTPATIVALLGFALVMLAATVAIFSYKELAAAPSRET